MLISLLLTSSRWLFVCPLHNEAGQPQTALGIIKLLMLIL
jgi:hypothetical protein